jgi:hypothetical protein
MKNQLLQAFAALEFARRKGKKLRFHINSTRIEANGGNVMSNLMQFFMQLNDAELIPHQWIQPEDLPNVLSKLDLGLQISMTETFNIVTADYVSSGIPVIVSKEIDWIDHRCIAADHDLHAMANVMDNILESSEQVVLSNQWRLKQHSQFALGDWTQWARAISNQ